MGGGSSAALLGALFLSVLHSGCVIPEKSEEEWDLVINYFCIVGP